MVGTMAWCRMKENGDTHIVIGSGVVGLCSAYYLAKAGHRVTVIDRDPSRRESCSNGNAGTATMAS